MIMQHEAHPETPSSQKAFPTDPSGLPEATRPELLEVTDGEAFDLHVGPVAKRLGDTTVRMLGYNGSVATTTTSSPSTSGATHSGARHDAHDGSGQTARPTSWKRFARHYLVMVVAMYAGMLVLDPVYAAIATRAGYADPWAELPVISALVMAVNMTVPMVLLMLRHRHGAVAIVEMAGSMVAPTLAATGLYVLGALQADQVMSGAHLAMFPAMLLVMLRRYRLYAA
jgi:hypothetical protein